MIYELGSLANDNTFDMPINTLTSTITFEQLIDQVPVIIRVFDCKGHCIALNKQWSRYTGQSNNNAVGLGWLDVVHPDDRRATSEVFIMAAETKTEAKHIYRLRSESGDYRWMLDRAKPLYDAQENVIGHVGTITDIHLRKLAEENAKQNELKYRESEFRFINLVQKLPIGVHYADKEGCIKFVNQEALRMWGTSSDASLIRWSGVYKIYDAAGKLMSLDEYPIRKSIIEWRPRIDEATIEARTGERIYVICYTQPVFDVEGGCIGVMEFTVDISDRKAYREKLEALMRGMEHQIEMRTAELKEANDNLRRTNNDLEQYAYIASHDLQEPLRKIRLFVNMLLSEEPQDAERFKSYLSKIEASATRMSTLIRDVLNYSTVLKYLPHFEQVDLNNVIRETLAEFKQEIAAQDACVKVSSLPTIRGVYSQLHLLFNNLMGNSLTFSNGQPLIEITSTEETHSRGNLDPNVQYIKISFKDNGIGFNPVYASRIFDIFKRLHNKGSHTGNGMGLPLCKKIVEYHKGYISATSTEGIGSTFEIYLPKAGNQH